MIGVTEIAKEETEIEWKRKEIGPTEETGRSERELIDGIEIIGELNRNKSLGHF